MARRRPTLAGAASTSGDAPGPTGLHFPSRQKSQSAGFRPSIGARVRRPSSVVQCVRSASSAKHAQPCFVPWIAFCVLLRPCVSCACGVVHPASATCRGNWSSRVRADPSGFVASVAMPGVSFQSRLLAVAQPAIWTKSRKSFACGPSARAIAFSGSEYSPPALAFVAGVGQPVISGSDMRAAEARSRQKRRPEGVTLCFQVSRYKIEPVASVFNLLSNDCCRAALADKVVEGGP